MNHTVDELISQSRHLIAANQLSEAAACLGAVLKDDPACLAAHNLVEQHRLKGNFTYWTGVDARISEADDIFRFFATHPTSINPVRDYLADGWRTLSELMLLLESLDRRLQHSGRFLEFACGHGRFTRHLQRWLPAGSVHVSDVVPGSVDFLQETLGVQGFYSSMSPDEVRWPSDYETVFVLSLFSHLPRQTWAAWLNRLWEATAPGGVLVISTHGHAAALKAGVDIGADGFAYFPGSESSVLDASAYGCTYTSLQFVESAVNDLAPAARMSVLPGHFWAEQDGIALQK